MLRWHSTVRIHFSGSFGRLLEHVPLLGVAPRPVGAADLGQGFAVGGQRPCFAGFDDPASLLLCREKDQRLAFPRHVGGESIAFSIDAVARCADHVGAIVGILTARATRDRRDLQGVAFLFDAVRVALQRGFRTLLHVLFPETREVRVGLRTEVRGTEHDDERREREKEPFHRLLLNSGIARPPGSDARSSRPGSRCRRSASRNSWSARAQRGSRAWSSPRWLPLRYTPYCCTASRCSR